MTPPLAEALATFVVDTGIEQIDQATIETAKLRLLDCVGSLLWSCHTGVGAATATALSRLGGDKDARLIGTSLKLPAIWAAYANAIAASALCDTCRFSETHPCTVIIPTVLALGERDQVPGKTVLEAMIIGYEVMVRLGRAIPVSTRGFCSTASLGAIGAAAAAAKILGLSHAQTTSAIALAVGASSGVLEAYGDLNGARHQLFANAAHAGILSATLAAGGITANARLLEGGVIKGVPGFADAISDGAVLARLTEGLGQRYLVTQVGAKIHEGCRFTHGAIDGALDLVARLGLTADDIEAIDIGTFSKALEVRVAKPQTVGGMKFNMEYLVATAILDGDVSVDKFAIERLADPRVISLMERIHVRLDEESERTYPERWGVVMSVRLRNGQVHELTRDFPRGEPEDPLILDDCRTRLARLATPLLGHERQEQIVARILTIEGAASLEGLLELMTPGVAAGSERPLVEAA